MPKKQAASAVIDVPHSVALEPQFTESSIASQERSVPMPATQEAESIDLEGGTFNLEAIDENAGIEALANGTYPFQVDQAQYGPSQSSGKPMITLRLNIDGAEDPEANGRKLFYHMVMEGFGLQRLKKAIMILAPEADMRNFVPAKCEDIFLGTRGVAKVTTRMYEGRRVNNVKDILPDQQGGFFGT